MWFELIMQVGVEGRKPTGWEGPENNYPVFEFPSHAQCILLADANIGSSINICCLRFCSASCSVGSSLSQCLEKRMGWISGGVCFVAELRKLQNKELEKACRAQLLYFNKQNSRHQEKVNGRLVFFFIKAVLCDSSLRLSGFWLSYRQAPPVCCPN